MRALVIVLLLAGTAHAQSEDDTKSETAATWLSIGGTAAAYVGLAESTRITDNSHGATSRGLIAADVAGLLVLPSLGQFYADDWHPTGLAIRAAGLAAIVVGAKSEDAACGDGFCPTMLLVLVGVLTVATGTIYDIGMAGESAHAYNRAHRVSIAPTVLNPPSGPVMGIGMGGEF
jgi:hypothetical protein